jgi:hypothetical protein
MLFTKQLIFNSLITAKSLSVKYSKTIIILTSLSFEFKGGKRANDKNKNQAKHQEEGKRKIMKN